MPAIAQAPLDRNGLFFGLFLLAALNGVAGTAVRTVQEVGWGVGLASLLGVSAVVWAALAAGLAILRGARGEGPRRGDAAVALTVAAVALIPAATASVAALTLLAAWAILTAAPGSPIRRAGIVFLAMAGALLWGRLILALFSGPLLDLDAAFVSGVVGAQQQGNMLWLDEGGGARLVVAPGCSSMQGMSLALLFWAMVNQLFGVRFGWKPALWCLAALAATVAINVARIGAMLRYPAHLDSIHTGLGYHLSMWLTLAAVAAICLWGARREIFGR